MQPLRHSSLKLVFSPPHGAFMSPTGTPLSSEETGKSRWQRSASDVALEYELRDQIFEIDRRLHQIAVDATYRSSATLPVPEEYVDVAKDLRKGKRSLGGATFRIFAILFRREHPKAEVLTQEICDLIQRRRDLMIRIALIGKRRATPTAPVADAAPAMPAGTTSPLPARRVHVIRPVLAAKAAGAR